MAPETDCVKEFFHRLGRWEGFPGGAVVKYLLVNARDQSLIPGLGRSPGVGNGNPFQHSCLENSEEPGGLQSMGLQRVRHD